MIVKFRENTIKQLKSKSTGSNTHSAADDSETVIRCMKERLEKQTNYERFAIENLELRGSYFV
jgi:hypothetical protein